MPTPSFHLLVSGAHAGIAECQLQLGCALVYGSGVPAGPRAGVEWLRKAVLAGNNMARVQLYVCYRDGLAGLRPDDPAAVPLLRAAAEGGHVPAQTEMMIRLRRGDGMPANDAEANVWGLRAVAGGCQEGLGDMGNRLLRGTGIATDAVKGVAMLRRAAAMDDLEACANLGDAHAHGWGGLPVDAAAARALYDRAAKSGVDGTASFARRRLHDHASGRAPVHPLTVAVSPVCGRSGCGAALNAGTLSGLCNGCRAVRYCGHDCQRADWPAHRAACKATRPATVAATNAALPVGSTTSTSPGAPASLLAAAASSDSSATPNTAPSAELTAQRAEVELWRRMPLDALRAAAEEGTPAAQAALGDAYFDGDYGVKQDVSAGIGWLRKAAIAGMLPARIELGRAAELAAGAPGADTRTLALEGIAWLLPLATAGDAAAQLTISKCYVHQEAGAPHDFASVFAAHAEAGRWLRTAAASGLAAGIEGLARALWDGNPLMHVAMDCDEARRLFTASDAAGTTEETRRDRPAGAPGSRQQSRSLHPTEAPPSLADSSAAPGAPDYGREVYRFARADAVAGSLKSQFYASAMLLDGMGVPADPHAGVEWLRTAASAGHIVARFKLFCCYRDGKAGLRPDDPAAVPLLRAAAEGGHVPAQTEPMIRLRRGDGMPADDAEANEWGRRAAASGDAYARMDMGSRLLHGQGIARDAVEGVAMLRAAAEGGYAPAQCHLSCCLRDGDGMPADDAEANVWGLLAAASGDAYALGGMGNRLLHGMGIAPDAVQGVAMLRRAADAGFFPACASLGDAHANGWGGLPVNVAAARVLYERAAAGSESHPAFYARRRLHDLATAPVPAATPDFIAPVCGRAGCGAELDAGTLSGLCKGCRAVHYCGQDCQRTDWRAHRAACKAAEAARAVTASNAAVPAASTAPAAFTAPASSNSSAAPDSAPTAELTAQRAEVAMWRRMPPNALRTAAEEGTPAAQAALGNAYLDGMLGLERDEVAGLRWLHTAATAGLLPARLRLGMAALQTAETPGADAAESSAAGIVTLLPLAMAGDAAAQYILYRCVACFKRNCTGQVAQGITLSASAWLRKAAAHGDPLAMDDLATMMWDGHAGMGVAGDRDGARRLFAAADAAGVAEEERADRPAGAAGSAAGADGAPGSQRAVPRGEGGRRGAYIIR